MNNVFPIKKIVAENALEKEKLESLDTVIKDMDDFNVQCDAINQLKKETNIIDYEKTHHIKEKKYGLISLQILSAIGMLSLLPSIMTPESVKYSWFVSFQIINLVSTYGLVKIHSFKNNFDNNINIKIKDKQCKDKEKEMLEWVKEKKLEEKLIALYKMEIEEAEPSKAYLIKKTLGSLVSKLISKNSEIVSTDTRFKKPFSSDNNNVNYYLGLNEYLNDLNAMKEEKNILNLHNLKYHKSFFKKDPLNYLYKLKDKL